MAHKNCRNCKHAGWYRHPSGRKAFGNWAPCNAPVDHILLLLPDSAWEAKQALESEKIGRKRSVIYRNEPMNCPAWEKEVKSTT